MPPPPPLTSSSSLQQYHFLPRLPCSPYPIFHASQVRRLNMQNQRPTRDKKGKLIHQDLQSKELPSTRIQPDRRYAIHRSVSMTRSALIWFCLSHAKPSLSSLCSNCTCFLLLSSSELSTCFACRWFGNTRVIGQKQLDLFRSEMSTKVNDAYTVLLRQAAKVAAWLIINWIIC